MRHKTKFRAFIRDYQSPEDDLAKDQMVQWFLDFFSDMSYSSKFPSDSNDVFLMQWSGLYDIDGVEIYEFDIVDIISKTTTFTDVIIFENGCFGGVNNGRNIFNEKIRVIGNTYEHQQLIPPTTRKEWRIVPDESCHECGDCILAETPFNYPYGLWDDSAKVKCSACNKSGWLSVDEWGINYDF